MTVSELIEKLMEYPLDSTATVFYDRYTGGDYEQGEEEPVVVADGAFVLITTSSAEEAARYWTKR